MKPKSSPQIQISYLRLRILVIFRAGYWHHRMFLGHDSPTNRSCSVLAYQREVFATLIVTWPRHNNKRSNFRATPSIYVVQRMLRRGCPSCPLPTLTPTRLLSPQTWGGICLVWVYLEPLLRCWCRLKPYMSPQQPQVPPCLKQWYVHLSGLIHKNFLQ
jgi:hypothetical protein